jgi:hypothetical protein
MAARQIPTLVNEITSAHSLLIQNLQPSISPTPLLLKVLGPSFPGSGLTEARHIFLLISGFPVMAFLFAAVVGFPGPKSYTNPSPAVAAP